MWGERGLISHKFEGTGEGVLACALKGGPGAAREFTVQLGVSRACSWRLPDGPGWQLGGCTMGVQLAVARWARLAAGRVHNGRSAGGCPMGQAVSWAGAQWACSWRLPDGPGWQQGGCTMGVQLAVARWARLADGWVHNGRAAGGCPIGQAGSWGCTMGVQLAVARWARLAAGGALWACHGYPGSLPRMPDTNAWYADAICFSHQIYGNGLMASDIAQIIYIYSDII